MQASSGKADPSVKLSEECKVKYVQKKKHFGADLNRTPWHIPMKSLACCLNLFYSSGYFVKSASQIIMLMCTLKCKLYHKREKEFCLIISSFCAGAQMLQTGGWTELLGSFQPRSKYRFALPEFVPSLVLNTFWTCSKFPVQPPPKNIFSFHKAKLDVNHR